LVGLEIRPKTAQIFSADGIECFLGCAVNAELNGVSIATLKRPVNWLIGKYAALGSCGA
jgi:hypothetical protein